MPHRQTKEQQQQHSRQDLASFTSFLYRFTLFLLLSTSPAGCLQRDGRRYPFHNLPPPTLQEASRPTQPAPFMLQPQLVNAWRTQTTAHCFQRLLSKQLPQSSTERYLAMWMGWLDDSKLLFSLASAVSWVSHLAHKRWHDSPCLVDLQF